MAGKRLDVFTVTEPRREGQKGFWVKLGSAFENRDGSLSVFLDALPVNGKLVIAEHRERTQAPKDAQGGDGFGDDQIPF